MGSSKSTEVVGQRQSVTLLDGSQTPYVNLDNAASTPALVSVMKEINDFMPMYSSVHRGTGLKSRYSTDRYEKARETVLAFVGGNHNDHIVIFGSNTTDAINKVSYRLNLSEDDVVITSIVEHHSNDLPWRFKANAQRVDIDSRGSIDMKHLKALLKKHTGKVKLVTISGASNVTGHIPDIHAIAELAHEAGAQIMVDAAQLAPHRPIDVRKLEDAAHIDYLALSAHKMYAPFGTGALIARKDTFQSGAPEFTGGGTIDFVSTENVDWADSPERDEAGSPNVVGAVALARAMDELAKIGMDTIAAHEIELTTYVIAKLKEIPKLTLYGDTRADQLKKRTGVITFSVDGLNHALVAAILGAEWGIGVRSGCFCAHPYVIKLLDISKTELQTLRTNKLSTEAQPIPGLVRASLGIYNTTDDIDRLIEALHSIADGDYSQDYYFDSNTGSYEIDGWPQYKH